MFSGWLFGQVCRDTVTLVGGGGLFGQVFRYTVMFRGGCLDRYVVMFWGWLFGQVCRDTVMFLGGCLNRCAGMLACFGVAIWAGIQGCCHVGGEGVGGGAVWTGMQGCCVSGVAVWMCNCNPHLLIDRYAET